MEYDNLKEITDWINRDFAPEVQKQVCEEFTIPHRTNDNDMMI